MPSYLPILPEYADLVGPWGERIDNQSLLFEKFALPQHWIEKRPFLNPDAKRLSLLRLSEGGRSQLALERNDRRSRDGFKDTVGHLLNTAAASGELDKLRTHHSKRLLQLVESSYGDRCCVIYGKLKSRLAINLADGLVENGGMALDRLFGMPYIPGSAVKGVSRHAAFQQLSELDSKQDEQRACLQEYIDIFGTAQSQWQREHSLKKFANLLPSTTDRKGKVVFMPAYPLTRAELEIDLTNVHTPSYYTGRNAGTEGELKQERPLPNPFPTVAPDCVFGFVITTNENGEAAIALLKAAKTYLELALTASGIGAKTSSGYGWFEIIENPFLGNSDDIKTGTNETTIQETTVAKNPVPKVNTTADDQAFAAKVSELDTLPEDEQREILALLLGDRKDRFKRWRKSKKPADTEKMKKVGSVADKLGIKLP